MSEIPWRYYLRYKAPPQPWTDSRRVQSLFAVPKTYLPAKFGGVVQAATRAEALTLAQALCEDAKATVDVIAEAAWGTLTDLERQVFLGTFEPPHVKDAVSRFTERWRISKCSKCGGEIRKKLDPRKNHHGRPRKYCSKCETPKAKRWRKYQAAMRAAGR